MPEQKLTKIELQLRVSQLQDVIERSEALGLNYTAAECRRAVIDCKKRIKRMEKAGALRNAAPALIQASEDLERLWPLLREWKSAYDNAGVNDSALAGKRMLDAEDALSAFLEDYRQ